MEITRSKFNNKLSTAIKWLRFKNHKWIGIIQVKVSHLPRINIFLTSRIDMPLLTYKIKRIKLTEKKNLNKVNLTMLWDWVKITVSILMEFVKSSALHTNCKITIIMLLRDSSMTQPERWASQVVLNHWKRLPLQLSGTSTINTNLNTKSTKIMVSYTHKWMEVKGILELMYNTMAILKTEVVSKKLTPGTTVNLLLQNVI